MKRELARSREVGEILARYGFKALAVTAGLAPGRKSAGRGDMDEENGALALETATPEVLVAALTELGTAWVKFGQMLATRRDLLPAEYCDALETLTDHAQPVPFESIRSTITTSLDIDLSDRFEFLDPAPLGTASVAQVHAARTLDGTDVVVKVRKPRVLENVLVDLDLMERLVRTLSRARPQLEDFGAVETVRAFADTMRAELDFRTEAAACEEMAERFADDPTINIPGIDRTLTTMDVMAQERVTGGIRIDNMSALEAAGLDQAEIGHRYADALMRQLFSFGRFHADPHAGNVFAHADGSLTFIDWGMVGTVDTATRHALLRLIAGFSLQHEGILISALLDIATPRHHLDRAALRRDVGELVRMLQTTALAHLSAAEIGTMVTRIVRQHHLRLDPSIPVVLRALAVAEGLVRRLAPDLSIPDLAATHARASFAEELRPEALKQLATDRLGDAIVFTRDLPARLSRVLDVLESGEYEVGLSRDSTNKLRRQQDKNTRRLAGSMLASAGMVAGSIVWSAWYRRRGS